MQVGLLTLGDLLPDPRTGERRSDAARHRQIVEQAARAEQLGFDAVHLGEHHGSGYQLSSPPVVLAAVAERTTRILLSTGVTLLANLDPVRVAEDYSTLDCLSGGRAEIVAGRGSFFARTFEYFGQDPGASRELFDEHAALLVRLLRDDVVEHPGGRRAALPAFTVRPRPVRPIPLWLGGGSSAATPRLAARLGLPLMLPSVFAPPEAFAPLAATYREAWEAAGHRDAPTVGACCHCHVGPTSEGARAAFRAWYGQYWDWVQDLIADYTPHARKLPFDFEALLAGPAICGGPAEVVDRVGRWNDLLGLSRMAFMFDLGGIPDPDLWDTLDRFGSEVLPHLRALGGPSERRAPVAAPVGAADAGATADGASPHG